MRPAAKSVLLAAVCCAAAPGAQLTAAAEEDFRRYIEEVEAGFTARIDGRRPFLWVDENDAREAAVRQQGIVVEPSSGKKGKSVRKGLIHDWTAAAFLPDATVTRVVAVVTDYDNHVETYKPEVTDSKLLQRDGADYHVFLRLKKKKVLTAVLDTEHRAEYKPLDDLRWFGISRSVRIQEVRGAGSPRESLKPVGQDNGFLWKLNVYWRFAQVSGGAVAECRAVSLTRDVPFGLGWVIRPIVQSLPRESLENTLRATRRAVVEQESGGAAGATIKTAQ